MPSSLKKPLAHTETKKFQLSSTVVIDPRRRLSNRRTEQTIHIIFAATEAVIIQSLTQRFSILDVCKTAAISRSKFYRFFASHESLMEAYAIYKRESFLQALIDKIGPSEDPEAHLLALVQYLDAYLNNGSSRSLLLAAPEFALNLFNNIFHDAILHFQELLSSVFSLWDQRLKMKLDRELICEMIVRLMLSENLIVDSKKTVNLSERITQMLSMMRFESKDATALWAVALKC